MDIGTDAFLARQFAAYDRRCADDDYKQDLIESRAQELGSDATRFLEWAAEHGFDLTDITVSSRTTDRRMSAFAALVAHAPTWLREAACQAIAEDRNLEGVTVYIAGDPVDIEVALVANAPQWLRDELVDWLSNTSQLDEDVEAGIAEQQRQHEEDRAADRYWSEA